MNTFGFSAPQDPYANDGWDLNGDLELFLGIEELLTGERKSYWEHKSGIGISMFRNCYTKIAST